MERRNIRFRERKKQRANYFIKREGVYGIEIGIDPQQIIHY